MMVLYNSPTSPFGRKVRVAAAMLGMSDALEVVKSDITDPQDRIRLHNPLGKIPALVLDEGPVIFDSAVILEYLDHRAGGGRIIPTESDRRFRVLTEQALADGLMEAALLQVYEGRFRAEDRRGETWLTHQAEKVERALLAFENATPAGSRSVADITLACALGYLDLRFAGRWRADHPHLVAWLKDFEAEVPAFAATRFTG
jgi:glutathione S-transferase